MTASSRFAKAKTAVLKDTIELRAFLGYAVIVLSPGAKPPQHPQSKPGGPQRTPNGWTASEYDAYIEEARRDMDGQQNDKRDIRSRGQIVLTTALVLGGTIAASYADKPEVGVTGRLLYLTALVLTGLTALAAGGIITAQSPIGVPNLQNLLRMPTGDVYKRLADEYAATRHEGAATVAMLVTVLRFCVRVLLLGASVLGLAHVTA